MSEQLVEFIKEEDVLRIRLLPEGREKVERLYDSWKQSRPGPGGPTWFSIARDIFEDQLCNGWAWPRPEQIGSLTDDWKPILTDDYTLDGEGGYSHVGVVYYDHLYERRDHIEDLLREGEIFFQKLPE